MSNIAQMEKAVAKFYGEPHLKHIQLTNCDSERDYEKELELFYRKVIIARLDGLKNYTDLLHATIMGSFETPRPFNV